MTSCISAQQAPEGVSRSKGAAVYSRDEHGFATMINIPFTLKNPPFIARIFCRRAVLQRLEIAG